MDKSEKFKKSLYRIYGLFVKEVKVLLKDKFAMIIIFALPIFLVLFLGGVFGGGIGRTGEDGGDLGSLMGGLEIPSIGLVDNDNSEGFPDIDLSKLFVNKCNSYDNRGVVNIIESNNQSELEVWLGKGLINAYIVIPEMFEYNLSIHFPTMIVVVIDSLDMMLLSSSQSIIDLMIDDFKEEYNFTGVFNYEITRANVPETGKQLFCGAPLFFPMVLFSIASLTGAQLIVSDIPKDRMSLTPANKLEIILGKLFSLQFLMIILIIPMLILSFFLGLRIRGSILDFFWILFLNALLGVIFGLFMSCLAKEPLEALQFFIFFFVFQIIAVLFVQDENILKFLPLYNGYMLVITVALRGQSPLSVSIYYLYQYAECIFVFIGAYLIYRQKKVLL